MSLTLLVENNQILENFYHLNLQTWVGADVIARKNAKSCTDIFQENPAISCIIVRSRNGQEKSAEAMYEIIVNHNLNIPMIVLGKSTIQDRQVIHFDSGLDIKPLLQSVAKALGVTAQDMARLEVENYIPITIHFFYFLKRSICNVFLENNGQYEKILDAYEEFGLDKIKSLIEKGIVNLYVQKYDRLKFVNNLTQEMVTRIDEASLNSDEQMTATEMGIKLLTQKLSYLGIREETISLANRQMKKMNNIARKYPKMRKLLERLTANKTGYLFKHGIILTYVCTHVMKNIDWGSADQIKKIAFVAFFHDILLENDEEAMIHTQRALKESSLDPKSKELVNMHAQMAAELIIKYPHAPMGADIIIRQHHGVSHGIGFSETYGGNLSPMTIVFILAQEFTDHVIRYGADLNIAIIINEMREKYHTKRFQKILDSMEKISL